MARGFNHCFVRAGHALTLGNLHYLLTSVVEPSCFRSRARPELRGQRRSCIDARETCVSEFKPNVLSGYSEEKVARQDGGEGGILLDKRETPVFMICLFGT